MAAKARRDVVSDPVKHQQLYSALEARLFGRTNVPIKLARYQLGQKIGGGGLGLVYEATDPMLDRKVAIKILRGDVTNERAKVMLKREAQAVARLNHPNIVTLYDVGTFGPNELPEAFLGKEAAEGGAFVVMELIRGRTLQRWLTAPDRTPTEILETFRLVAEGLSAAHRAGVIHRDFKPSNVLIGEDGTPRILDFGLARLIERRNRDRVREGPSSVVPVEQTDALRTLQPTGMSIGTPLYMSPEQHRGDRLDERSDQYSFCLSLFEALYRFYPFPEIDFVLLGKAKLQRPKAPWKRGVPWRVRKVLRRGLSPEPEDRFENMSVLLEHLPAPKGRGWWG